MFNQIIVVHFKLKFKLMEKGLVPKQIALFQIQPETECVQPSALRVNVEGDLSPVWQGHTLVAHPQLGAAWRVECWPHMAVSHRHQEPVEVNLNLLKQHVHPTPMGK